jgi:hypothetical protein
LAAPNHARVFKPAVPDWHFYLQCRANARSNVRPSARPAKTSPPAGIAALRSTLTGFTLAVTLSLAAHQPSIVTRTNAGIIALSNKHSAIHRDMSNIL